MEPKTELYHQIDEMVDYILDIEPQARVEVENATYEDEHANLSVYPPLAWDEDRCLALQRQIGERVSDVHLETGYLILVGVYSPDQQVEEAARELEWAKKKLQSAEKILSEAVTLGILKPTSHVNGLVSA